MCVHVYVRVCRTVYVSVCALRNATMEGGKGLQLFEWFHESIPGCDVFCEDFIEKLSQMLIRLGLETGKGFSYLF